MNKQTEKVRKKEGKSKGGDLGGEKGRMKWLYVWISLMTYLLTKKGILFGFSVIYPPQVFTYYLFSNNKANEESITNKNNVFL